MLAGPKNVNITIDRLWQVESHFCFPGTGKTFYINGFQAPVILYN